MTASGYRVSFWGDENVLEIDSDDIGTVLIPMSPTSLQARATVAALGT